MIYMYGFLVGAQIVLGQYLWKVATSRQALELQAEYIFSFNFIKFLTSPLVVLGAVSYLSATVMYIVFLSKFQYSQFQAIVVTSSLVITFIVAGTLLSERLQIVHIIGLIFLLLGVVLVTR